jgi:hypothetical protein
MSTIAPNGETGRQRCIEKPSKTCFCRNICDLPPVTADDGGAKHKETGRSGRFVEPDEPAQQGQMGNGQQSFTIQKIFFADSINLD